MKSNLTKRRLMLPTKGKPPVDVACTDEQLEIEEALDLIQNIAFLPMGESASRDRKVMRAWGDGHSVS